MKRAPSATSVTHALIRKAAPDLRPGVMGMIGYGTFHSKLDDRDEVALFLFALVREAATLGGTGQA